MRQRVEKDVEPSRRQGVQCHEAGQRRHAREVGIEPPAGRRPVRPGGEHADQQQPAPKGRQRQSQRARQPHDLVDPAIVIARRKAAEDQAGSRDEQQGIDREFRRGAGRAGDLAQHGRAGTDRRAEIAVQELPQIDRVLHPYRPVEPETVPDMFDDRRARMIARHQPRHVGRHQMEIAKVTSVAPNSVKASPPSRRRTRRSSATCASPGLMSAG